MSTPDRRGRVRRARDAQDSLYDEWQDICMTTTSRPVTVRLPEDVRRFIESRPETTTSVVIGALRAEMRRAESEREIAVCTAAGGDPYGIEPQDPEKLAEVWKDLDW